MIWTCRIKKSSVIVFVCRDCARAVILRLDTSKCPEIGGEHDR